MKDSAYKKPFLKALKESGFQDKGQVIFVESRLKPNTIRVKLWMAEDVFEAPTAKQKQLEAALKRNYPGYITGYFIPGARGLGDHTRALCIILKNTD
jgi:isopenicillin N synthase-like dioxygenase